MFCNKCGSETTDGSRFCPYCGNGISGEGDSSAAQQNLRIGRMQKRFSSIFVDKSEQLVSVLGSSFATNFLATGVLDSGFAILTDKRVYFKGKCIYRKGKWLRFLQEERTVDNKDITGVGFVHNTCLWALALFWITLIMTIVFLLAILSGNEDGGTMAGIWMFLTALFWCVYKLQTRSLFEIAFAGGRIAFDLQQISLSEAQKFQKQIIQTKEREARKQRTSASLTQIEVPDVAKQLQEVTALYRQGVISEQQFEQLKNKLIHG